MTNHANQLRLWLVTIVVIHAAVALWHGAAHVQVPVPLTTLQQAFVAIVVLLLPLVGAGLLWSSRKRAGAMLIALAMLASLIFGIMNHYVLHSPDHVTEVPEHPWRHTFVLSAALVAITEAIGMLLGALAAKKWQQSTS